MKTFRDRFLEDYAATEKPADNKKGFKIEYVYSGPWYRWDISPKALKTCKYLIGTAYLVNVILFFLAGTQPASLNSTAYVGIPVAISLIALMYEALGTVRFCTSKTKMTRPIFNSIDTKLKLAPLFHAILMLLAALAGLYELIFISKAANALSAFVLAGYLLCAGLSAFIFFRYRMIPFSTERNRTPLDLQKETRDSRDGHQNR